MHTCTFQYSKATENFFASAFRGKLAIHVPMFRSQNSPSGVHKSVVSGGSTPQTAERAFGSLSRRLVSSKSIEEYANSRQKESAQSTCGSRFYDKSKEIRTATKSVSVLHRG